MKVEYTQQFMGQVEYTHSVPQRVTFDHVKVKLSQI
jgi:hypothetical protein